MIELSDIIGTSAFAVSALFVYKKYQLDLLGLFIIAVLTALGGGVIRSTLLQETPLILIDNTPIMIVLVSLVAGYLLKIKRSFEEKNVFLFFDTIGLISFSITGSLIAMEHNLGYFGVIFMALISAVGGGVMRDMLLNRIPFVLTGGFYGTISLIIGTIIFLFEDVNMIAVFFIGLIIRFISIKYKWNVTI